MEWSEVRKLLGQKAIFTQRLAAGDIDGDGRSDLAVIRRDHFEGAVLYSQGTVGFSDSANLSITYSAVMDSTWWRSSRGAVVGTHDGVAGLATGDVEPVVGGKPGAHQGATLWNTYSDDITKDEFGITSAMKLGERVAERFRGERLIHQPGDHA